MLQYENETLRLEVQERIEGTCWVWVMFVNAHTLTLKNEREESDEDVKESDGVSEEMRE